MKRNTATALAVVVLGWFYFNHMQDPVARYTAYPFDYRDVVVSAAEKEEVSPSLVASVILAESKYKNTAESETGGTWSNATHAGYSPLGSTTNGAW